MTVRPLSLIMLLIACLPASSGFGQGGEENPFPTFAQQGDPDKEGLELLQSEPYDLIRFKKEAKGGWAKIVLLAARTMPNDPIGKLKVTVLGVDDKQFQASWKDIESIDFWEKRLERETREHIARGDFDGAYPYLAILIRDFPNMPGLRDLRNDYLLQDAGKRYKKARETGDKQFYKGTLAMLEELYRYDPTFRPDAVLKMISSLTDDMLRDMVRQEDMRGAQQVLARLGEDYPGGQITSIKKWDREFLRMAKEKQQQAIAARNRKDYRGARKLARESIFLYPKIPRGTELVRAIDREYPLVRVGVLQKATTLDPTNLHNWPARRAGRLVFRTLFEARGAGPEGGEYEFIFGETNESANRRDFTLMMRPSDLRPPLDQIDAFMVADALTRRANDKSQYYDRGWTSTLERLAINDPLTLQAQLRRPHALPSALLQIKIDGTWINGKPDDPTGAYRRDVIENELTRFVLNAEKPDVDTQPREIVEVYQSNAGDAVTSLLRGDLDIIDHLFPSDAQRLKERDDLVVRQYPLPSVHMLIPCSDDPFIMDRTFRRSLLYATNREDILKGELMEGMDIDGCQVVSGPFPAGVGSEDPLGYAYNRNVEPRTYQPRISGLLMTMAENGLKAKAEKDDEKAPVLQDRVIRLAVPKDNLARTAAEAIKTQWELLGKIKVKIVELPDGQSMPKEGTADLVYVVAAVWEPLTDARRLLGPQGLAKNENQLVGLGLRRLENEFLWQEISPRLHDLHFISHHELPVLPLWQMVDSYAYRKEMGGIGSDIVSLYQNVEKWRLKF